MDAPLLHGLFSILLLHICVSQALTSETLSALDSNLPLAAVIADEPEVTELTLTAPGSEQDAVQDAVKDVVQDVVQNAVQNAVEEAAPEAVEPVAVEPVAQDVEVPEEVSQEAAADVGEEVGAPAAEEEAAVEAAGEHAAPEEAVEEEKAVEEPGEQAVAEVTVAEAGEGAEEQAVAVPGAEAGDGGEQPEAEASEEVVEVGQEAAVEVGVEDGGELVVETGEVVEVDGTETEASQASETEEPDRTPGPADTYVPPQSQGPATVGSQAESNDVGREIDEESNDFNEIIAHKGELLNPVPAEAAPTPGIVAEEGEEVPATLPTPPLEGETGGDGEVVEATADAEGVALGLEAWKIGAISAAVFLFLETVVIIVYFLKCRKNKISGGVPVKASEDCEAAHTAAEETIVESAPAADEDQIQKNAISESLDKSQFQQEETMADIPLDHTESVCPEDPVEDVRTSVL